MSDQSGSYSKLIIIGVIVAVVSGVLVPIILKIYGPSVDRWTWDPGITLHPTEPNVVANQEYGEWRPAPGYAFVNPSNEKDRSVKWVPGLTHPNPKRPNIISAETRGEWKPAEGYRWARLDSENPGDPRQSRKGDSENLGKLRVGPIPGVVPIPAPVTKMLSSSWDKNEGKVKFKNEFDDLHDVSVTIRYSKEDGSLVDIKKNYEVWNKGEVVGEKLEAPNYEKLEMKGFALLRNGEKVAIHYEYSPK